MVNFLLPVRLTGRDKLLAEGMFDLKASPGPGLCMVAGCRKRHKDPRKVGTLLLCSRHWQARWRAKNPKKAAWRALKDHAKARRIGFTLDFAFFVSLTDAAGYWTQDAESHGDRLSIDRISITGPYSNDNVRVITVSENAALGNRMRFLSETVRGYVERRKGTFAAWHMEQEKSWLDIDDSTDDPF